MSSIRGWEKGKDWSKIIFAYTATALMVLVCFQAMVCEANDASTDTEEASWLYDASETPLYSQMPAGNVTSISEPYVVPITNVGLEKPRTYLTTESNSLYYWTPNGTYIFDNSRPFAFSLLSQSGIRLIDDSFFSLSVKGYSLTPSNAKIITLNEDILEVRYEVVDSTKSLSAMMGAKYNFTGGGSPKITAYVEKVDSKIAGWQVEWRVVPNEKTLVMSDEGKESIPFIDYVKGDLALSGQNVSLSVEDTPFILDWTDAKVGTASAVEEDSFGKVRQTLKVAFTEGTAVIDPTIIGTSTDPYPTGMNNQRKMFMYDGYFWLFYNTGNRIHYRTSMDGVTWSQAVALQGGTSPASGSGFDISFRNGVVAVAWIDTTSNLKFVKGTILSNNVTWSTAHTVASSAYYQPPSVAIGYDGSFWILYTYSASPYVKVLRSLTGLNQASWTGEKDVPIYDSKAGNNCLWYSLLPIANSTIALLETSHSTSGTNDVNIRLSYYQMGFSGSGWTTPVVYNLGMATYVTPEFKSAVFSALASSDGTVHIAYRDQTTGYIKYAGVATNGTISITSTTDVGLYPTISIDANQILHIYYVKTGTVDTIVHIQKPRSFGSWSSSDVIYTASTSSEKVKCLSSWVDPVVTAAICWSDSVSGSTSIEFASFPLPFGTPGSPSEPWDRDGISPYASYFAQNGDYVNPATGLMSCFHNDVSIDGRNDVDLDLSRLYQQPRYFLKSTATAYGSTVYPFSNLGEYWGLDLPWMDGVYVYLSNGMRFVINWGNENNVKEFVNHDSVHFVLRDVNKQGISYYELITSSGTRYQFEHDSPYRLTSISDLQGYDPESSAYSEPYNSIKFEYDGSGKLITIRDSALSRAISLSYNVNGLLSTVVQPDGGVTSYGYSSVSDANGTRWFLASVSDPASRVTTFTYNASAGYLMDSMTYPSNGRITWSYAQDNSPSTEAMTWLVTTEVVKNATSGALIRQASFSYTIVNGKVFSSKIVNYDSQGILQGSNEYVYQSAQKYTRETIRNDTGSQMRSSKTYYDLRGEPMMVDTYLGTSTTVNYTEYTNYDDWGNVIFTQDALGHQKYASYANTSTQYSFQGGQILKRTSTGAILYDNFDDLDSSDWTGSLTYGVKSLDIGAAPYSPAVKLTSTGSGSAYVERSFTAQTSDFIIQTDVKANELTRSFIEAYAGSNARARLSIYNGYLQYYTGSAWTNVAPCASNTWYDVGMYIHPSTAKYDIYLDGKLVKSSATLLSSGNIGKLRFTVSSTSQNAIWFNDVRVYKSLTVTINGLSSGYQVSLQDTSGNVTAVSKSNTLILPKLPLYTPPSSLTISKIGGSSFTTPVMDIWGGDVYTYSPGVSTSNLPKTSYGFAQTASVNPDNEGWPSQCIKWYSTFNGVDDGQWITNENITVNGNAYHQSSYVPVTSVVPNHYHGWMSGSVTYMRVVNTTDALIQYVYIPSGLVPQEICVQYQLSSSYPGTWKRAYWGGDANGNDIMVMNAASGLTPALSVRMGDVPETTGKWIQLTVKASDLGIGAGAYIYGTTYGLYGGAALWDYASTNSMGIEFSGLSSGMAVKMLLENGTTISQTATGSTMVMNPYDQGIRAFPIQCTFQIYDGNNELVYSSPEQTVYSSDKFQFSASNFYPNTIKGGIHDRLVGTFEYQDYASTVSEESYFQYNFEGNQVGTKSKLGSGWVYSHGTYDQFGNIISASDPSGVSSNIIYSAESNYTYATSTSNGGRTDSFDQDTTWQASLYSINNNTAWLTAQYSAAMASSGNKALQIGFANGSVGADTGSATMFKEYYTNAVSSISVKMYVSQYSHNNGYDTESMDSGVRLRLYDADGINYANYTYWLACWSYGSNNRSAPDTFTKVIFGQPALDQWLDLHLNPNADWSIDWNRCDKVRFELYASATETNGDYLTVNFDDFNYNDASATTNHGYDLRNGQLLYTTDALGLNTSYQYDILGRLIRTNDTDGINYSTISYDDVNNKVSMYDELGQRTVYIYDELGRLKQTVRYGLSSAPYSSTTVTYNWLDKIRTTTDAVGRTTIFSYDYQGRLTLTKNMNGTAWTQASVIYDDMNKTVTKIDELGHKVVSVLDSLDRLNATREYYSPTGYYQTLMSYDAMGNVKTIRTANGEVTRFSYDLLDRKTSNTYPDGFSGSWTYDLNGRIVSETTRSGIVKMTAYDCAGHVIRVLSTSDKYITKYNAGGLVTEARNNLGNFTYEYNDRNQVIHTVEKINGTSYSFSNSYDGTGKIISVSYPDSSSITYVYDNFNRVSQVKAGNNELLSLTYNLDDSIASKSECNGNSSVSYTYDFRGWTTSIIGRDRGSNVFFSLAYIYDGVGNVVSIRDNVGSAGTESYYYDWLNRLTRAIGAWGTINYGYDSVGNRLWINDGINQTYSYSTYNKLTSDSTWNYAYDRDGNVIWKNSTTLNTKFNYVYNSFGQMISVVKWVNGISTTIASYSYDANGARARTTEGSTTNDFVYKGTRTMCQFGADGKSNKYIYLGGQLQLRTCSATENYNYISDSLGSSRYVLKNGNTDVNNVVFSTVTYKPFGGVFTPTGSDRITFTGEVTDAPTGLVYLSARYLDPSTGRFFALDPEMGSTSSPQTLNRYVYCVNSPLIHTDTSGKIANWIIGGLIGAAFGAVGAAIEGKSIEQIGVAAGAGFVSGAICGATFGASTALGIVGSSIARGALGGVVEEGIKQGWDLGRGFQKSVNWYTIFAGGALGAFGGVKAGHLEKALDVSKESVKFTKRATNAVDATIISPEKSALSLVANKLSENNDASSKKSSGSSSPSNPSSVSAGAASNSYSPEAVRVLDAAIQKGNIQFLNAVVNQYNFDPSFVAQEEARLASRR